MLPQLTVHLVPHSHLDTGWLKTVDQCYLGANTTVQHAGVKYITSSIVGALLLDPARKFTWAEQAFFVRWWDEQGNHSRMLVRDLVRRGQLVFVDGGWSQHDEGCLHFSTMVDQSAFGNRFLVEALEVVPRIGWHLDVFGHTGTQAALLSADAGFDALYFARIDYQDRDTRRKAGRMEMVWRGSRSLGRASEIFTGALAQGSYCPPAAWKWSGESLSAAQHDGIPLCADARLGGSDGGACGARRAEHVDAFVSYVQGLANSSRGRHVMLLMGCDYEYENAAAWYTNIDTLIAAVNADGRVKALYSDPATYTAAKHAENLAWSVKRDDFMPCAQEWSEASGLRGHMYCAWHTRPPTIAMRTHQQRIFLAAHAHVAAADGLFARTPLIAHGHVAQHATDSSTHAQVAAADGLIALHADLPAISLLRIDAARADVSRVRHLSHRAPREWLLYLAPGAQAAAARVEWLPPGSTSAACARQPAATAHRLVAPHGIRAGAPRGGRRAHLPPRRRHGHFAPARGE